MPGANPVASAAFRIHGFYVIDSVLVVKPGCRQGDANQLLSIAQFFPYFGNLFC